MFLLTEGPHLYYVDASAMVLKGEIPWSATMKTELRDFRIFFVHVPGRIYYLIDNESTSKDWCAAIGKKKKKHALKKYVRFISNTIAMQFHEIFV